MIFGHHSAFHQSWGVANWISPHLVVAEPLPIDSGVWNPRAPSTKSSKPTLPSPMSQSGDWSSSCSSSISSHGVDVVSIRPIMRPVARPRARPGRQGSVTQYRCDLCDAYYSDRAKLPTFQRKMGLMRHQGTSRAHQEAVRRQFDGSLPPPVYNCSSCGKAYTRADNLRRHYIQCGSRPPSAYLQPGSLEEFDHTASVPISSTEEKNQLDVSMGE